ncbi:hypothetical protein LG314_01060 [Agrococcus terreus]|uniref:hypothetical protein n=1 Tax=Agrococcus terreus TaxID=574649 RepID=UPI00384B1B25
MHAPVRPAAVGRARIRVRDGAERIRGLVVVALATVALSSCAIPATDPMPIPGPSTGVTVPPPVVPTVRAPQPEPAALPEAPRPVATADGGWEPPSARPAATPTRPPYTPIPSPPPAAPTPTPAPPTGPTEVPTGGPSPVEGARYDLVVRCEPGARFWIDPAAPDGDFASFAPTTCDATIGHLELGVPAAWARAYAEPSVHASLVVQRTPSGSPLAATQVEALLAGVAADRPVDVVIWCITPGTVVLGDATATCAAGEPVWFDGMPLRSAFADLRLPSGFEGRGLLQLP